MKAKMHYFRNLKKILALLLVIITLHVTAHSLLHPRQLFEPLQERLTFAFSICAEDDCADQDSGDFKPPKHSFVDYTGYFGPELLLADYLPLVTDLTFLEPFRTMPQVYLDIPVPPPNFA